MNIKNILKIILFNTFFIILIILFFELVFCCFEVLTDVLPEANINHDINKFDCFKKRFNDSIKQYFQNWDYNFFNKNELRPSALYYIKSSYTNPVLRKQTKDDIILSGCSFTYGDKLTNEQSVHSQLSKYAHRNVFNIALSGGSPREILYILSNDTILNSLISDKTSVKDFIYIYIPDHKSRLYRNVRPIVPFYIASNRYKTLQFVYIPNFLDHSFLLRYINIFLYNNGFLKNKNKLFNLYMNEINNKIKNNFKNAKFTILVYNYDEDDIGMFKKLEKNGIKIIYLYRIVKVNIDDEKYKLDDKFHPNAKAWEVIVPALAKELKL